MSLWRKYNLESGVVYLLISFSLEDTAGILHKLIFSSNTSLVLHSFVFLANTLSIFQTHNRRIKAIQHNSSSLISYLIWRSKWPQRRMAPRRNRFIFKLAARYDAVDPWKWILDVLCSTDLESLRTTAVLHLWTLITCLTFSYSHSHFYSYLYSHLHFLISGQARKIWKRECFLDPQIFLSPIFGKEVIQENYFSLL